MSRTQRAASAGVANVLEAVRPVPRARAAPPPPPPSSADLIAAFTAAMEVQSTKIVDALKAGFTDGFGQVKASLEESVAARATRAQWTPAQTTVLFNCYKESGITTSKHLSKKVLGEKYKTLTDAVNQELGGAHYTVTQVQWKLKDATKVYKKLKADAEASGGGYDSDTEQEWYQAAADALSNSGELISPRRMLQTSALPLASPSTSSSASVASSMQSFSISDEDEGKSGVESTGSEVAVTNTKKRKKEVKEREKRPRKQSAVELFIQSKERDREEREKRRQEKEQQKEERVKEERRERDMLMMKLFGGTVDLLPPPLPPPPSPPRIPVSDLPSFLNKSPPRSHEDGDLPASPGPL